MRNILIILLLVNSKLTIGQVKTMSTIPADIVIEGVGVDSALIAKHDKTKSLKIFTSTLASSFIAPTLRHDFQIGSKTSFKLVLPSSKNLVYVVFALSSEKNGKLSNYDNTYIFEKGDRIWCELSEDDFKFFGKGSEKLNCQSEIYKIQYRNIESENALLVEKRYDEYFYTTTKRRDSILRSQLDIVNKYAAKLGERMTKIMKANCYGLRYYDLLRGYSLYFKNSDVQSNLLAYVTSDAYKKIDTDLDLDLKDEILIASPTYCNSLFEKITIDNSIDVNNKILKRVERSSSIYYSIIKNYHGIIREKLLTLFFLTERYRSGLGYLNNGLSYVKNTEFRLILEDLTNVTKKGNPFPSFSLEDSQGKIVNLSDFDDKIIVLDFWYTGCIWCAKLYDGMRPIIDKYKNNSKIKFVSVSIDRDKSTWLSSVATGNYADPNGLNLYTNGLGSKHPIIVKTMIQAYPTVFVIKNGNIFDAKPPRPSPSTNLNSKDAEKRFISLIERALIED